MILLFAPAVMLIPVEGLQNDEALFASSCFPPLGVAEAWKIPVRDGDFLEIPVMILSYLGALKTLILCPIYRIFPATLWSIRLPALLLAGFTAVGFFWILRRLGGGVAAWIGLALLCTDTSFLLTSIFDWGPVVLQRLLTMLCAATVLLYADNRRLIYLPAVGFFAGLGLWDKALFLWMGTGLAVGVGIVSLSELVRGLRVRHLLALCAGFVIGAFPFLAYNVRHKAETFSQNTHFARPAYSASLKVLETTLDGSSLFGYLTRSSESAAVKPPLRSKERLAVWLAETLPQVRHGWLPFLCVLSVLSLPLLPANHKRQVLACLLAFGAGLALMIHTRNAGASPHHITLLWPLPHAMAAFSLSGLSVRFPSARKVALVPIILVCLSGFLVTNAYIADGARYGSGLVWSDAILSLADHLEADPPRSVLVLDWGIFDSAKVLTNGKVPLFVGSDLLARDSLSEDESRYLLSLLQPGCVAVTHTPGNEIFEGYREKLIQFASAHGMIQSRQELVSDRHGRPIFEILAFANRVP